MRIVDGEIEVKDNADNTVLSMTIYNQKEVDFDKQVDKLREVFMLCSVTSESKGV